MKQETKELADWIKNTLSFARTIKIQTTGGLKAEFDNKYRKSLAFIDSVAELEKNLTKGGIIQDRFGKLCKDGDKVSVVTDGNKVVIGILKWSVEDKCFQVHSKAEDGRQEIRNLYNKYFEKVVE